MPTSHFDPSEFACSCCGKVNVRERLLSMLEVARSIYGLPMHITSGTRCPAHNAAVGGKDDSAHLTGEAADIYCGTSINRFRMVKALLSVGFNRIGIGKDFVHADISNTLPQEVMWVY